MGDAPRRFAGARIEALATTDKLNDIFGKQPKGHVVKGNNDLREEKKKSTGTGDLGDEVFLNARCPSRLNSSE